MAGKSDWESKSIPITAGGQLSAIDGVMWRRKRSFLTLVDQLKFGDDMKANFWEFILQHLQEHR
jgi:hypothetical protein